MNKIKKGIWITLVISLFTLLGIISIINIKKLYQYKNSYEYKLLNVGYSIEEINTLKNNLNDNDLDILVFKEEKDLSLINLMNEKNYDNNNLSKYLKYMKDNPDMSYHDIITIVNLNINSKSTKETDISKDILMIVNKHNYLNENYIPNDLVNIGPKYSYGTDNKIRKEVYDAFIKMHEDALKDNIYLMVTKGYKSYNEQLESYNKNPNSNVAKAGYSEHQTGLSLDIFSKDNTNIETFDKSKTFTWLKNNAYKYGFILRYPLKYEKITEYNYEPWHYRYVGNKASNIMYENSLTFEEYYNEYIN